MVVLRMNVVPSSFGLQQKSRNFKLTAARTMSNRDPEAHYIDDEEDDMSEEEEDEGYLDDEEYMDDLNDQDWDVASGGR